MDPDASPAREKAKASTDSRRESGGKLEQHFLAHKPEHMLLTPTYLADIPENNLLTQTFLADIPENKLLSPKSIGTPEGKSDVNSATSTGRGDNIVSNSARPSIMRSATLRSTASIPNDYVDNPMWRERRKSRLIERFSDARKRSVFDFPHSNTIEIPDADLTSWASLDLQQVPWWSSQRVLLSVICFFGFIMLYAQRVNISIAIVSMVVDEALEDLEFLLESNVSNKLKARDPNCPQPPQDKIDRGELYWDQTVQGMALGSFYWGYCVTQVPGGYIAEKFGARMVITCGMLPVAVLTILGPICARWDRYLFIASRVMLGLGSGVMYPAVQALWAHWAPPNERSRLLGFAYAGGEFGSALTFQMGGYMIATLGWTSAFYIIGGAGLFWVLIWFIFVADKPDQSKFITSIEKRYIQSCIGDSARNKTGSTPWYYIMTSKPVWAIILAHMFSNYITYLLLAMLPTYFKEVLHMDIRENGLYSSLPFFLFWILINVSAVIADRLISTNTMSIIHTRKLMTSLGLGLPGFGLIAVGYMGCDQQMGSVVLMVFTVGLCAFRYAGFFVSHADIAPPFAGTLFGISNMFASFPGFIAPAVTKALTYNGTREQWQSAFYVGAACSFAGVVSYLILAEGEIQWWAAGTEISIEEIEDILVEEEEEEVRSEKDKARSRCPLICGNGGKVGASK